jgi:general secretion pathway protein E
MSFFDRLVPAAQRQVVPVVDSATIMAAAPPSATVVSLQPRLAPILHTGASRAGVQIPLTAVEVKDAVPARAEEFAMLLAVPGDDAGYLLVLDTQAQAAKVHTLRQHLSAGYRPLHLVPVLAGELSQRRALSSGLSATAKGPSHQAVALNVARGFQMIKRAIELKASDIHIDVVAMGRQAPMVAIRYRVHGKLTLPEIDNTQQAVDHMVETIRGLYQNDDISPSATRVGGSTFDFPVTRRYEAMLKPPVQNAEVRFECLPEKAGFFAVMRLNGYDGKSAARKSLAALGLSPEQEIDLNHAALSPHGLILVVGPTGSGKTTTVTTVLALDPDAQFKRRISLEIPPESDVPWLSQIPTSEELLKDHADGVVRSDPDVISAGEVRNELTATMAQDYALTGHITFATFHGNSVFAGFIRLKSRRFAFDLDTLGSPGFLRAAFFQTLLGVLCDCKVPAQGHMDTDKLDLLKSKFGLESNGLYVRHRPTEHEEKCPICKGEGITERTAAIEVVVPNSSMLRLMAKGQMDEAEREYRHMRTARFTEPGTRGKTFVEHAIYKVSQGITCASEVFGIENLWTYEVVPVPCDQAPRKVA